MTKIWTWFFVAYNVIFITNCQKVPDGISKEIFCAGCEMTVKELDFTLRRRPTRGMGETVTRALKAVCKKENFDKYELDSKKALKVCKHIVGNRDMEDALIAAYGRKHELGVKTTYLDMTQKICGEVLNACPTANLFDLTNEKDGGITYNPETEEFEIKYGSKVRTPQPIRPGEPVIPRKEPEEHKTQKEKQDTIQIKEGFINSVHKHEEL